MRVPTCWVTFFQFFPKSRIAKYKHYSWLRTIGKNFETLSLHYGIILAPLAHFISAGLAKGTGPEVVDQWDGRGGVSFWNGNS